MARNVTCKGCGEFVDPMAHKCGRDKLKGGEANTPTRLADKAQPQAKAVEPTPGAVSAEEKLARIHALGAARAAEYRARKRLKP